MPDDKRHVELHIKFVHDGFSASGKTTIHRIYNQDNTAFLGYIKFNVQWRRYCFYPEANTVFDIKCLSIISEFIDLQMKQRVSYV